MFGDDAQREVSLKFVKWARFLRSSGRYRGEWKRPNQSNPIIRHLTESEHDEWRVILSRNYGDNRVSIFFRFLWLTSTYVENVLRYIVEDTIGTTSRWLTLSNPCKLSNPFLMLWTELGRRPEMERDKRDSGIAEESEPPIIALFPKDYIQHGKK